MTENEPMEPMGPPKSNKKLFIIIGAAVFLIAVVVVVLFFTGVIGGGDEEVDVNSADPAQAAQPVQPTRVLPTVALEPFVVNLADTETTRFLKITVVIELTNENLVDQIEQLKDKIRDSIITLLSSRTFNQIRDSKGKLKLKQEMTLRLNEILGTNAVNDVLFTDFIIS